MPVLDKPLEELREYMGSGICPSDIDEYWDFALEEMRSIDPDINLTLSEFQWPGIKCYDMYFTGVRGARIYAKLLKPDNSPGKTNPAVIRFHGYYGKKMEFYWRNIGIIFSNNFCWYFQRSLQRHFFWNGASNCNYFIVFFCR